MKHKKFDLIIDKKVSSFRKTIEVDPDKSTSIRFFLIGSISQKISFGKNILESQDVRCRAIRFNSIKESPGICSTGRVKTTNTFTS